MIFDTNSTYLQMAFPPTPPFAITFLLSFQNLTKVPVIGFIFPQNTCGPLWKTNISIWGKIKNTLGKQKQDGSQVVLCYSLNVCV